MYRFSQEFSSAVNQQFNALRGKGTLIFVVIWALFVYMDERGPFMGLEEAVKILWPLGAWVGIRLIFLPAKPQNNESPLD